MAIRTIGGSILMVGGSIAVNDNCCCDDNPDCSCTGTMPASWDVYFENCSGGFACLEGVTVNIERDFNSCGGSWRNMGNTGFVCGEVYNITVDSVGGEHKVYVELCNGPTGCCNTMLVLQQSITNCDDSTSDTYSSNICNVCCYGAALETDTYVTAV